MIKKIKNYIKYKLHIKHPSIYIKKYMLLQEKKKYTTSYSSQDILNILIKHGLKKGDTLFIHSSWDQMYNYNGTAKLLIDDIIEYLGAEGTLAMPCFPKIQDGSAIFDVRKTPSVAGFLTEIFRRYKGVERSISINHSVCAYGKYAQYLTSEHHLGITSWDEKSPYFKLGNIKAIIVGLGVGYDLKIATSLHCVEAKLRDKIYFYSLLFPHTITYQYIDKNGQIGTHSYLKRIGDINTKKISKYFLKDELKEERLSNLKIYSIRANILINKAIKLGENGITMYTNPKPKKKFFYNIDNKQSKNNNL